MAVLLKQTKKPRNIASFNGIEINSVNIQTSNVVINTCRIPPKTAYFFIAENFSMENYNPIINKRNITPNSAISVIMSVEVIN